MAEIRLVLATLLLNFDITRHATATAESMAKLDRFAFMAKSGRCPLLFHARK